MKKDRVFALMFKNYAGSLVKVDSIYSCASKAEAAAWAIKPPNGLSPWVVSFELDTPIPMKLDQVEVIVPKNHKNYCPIIGLFYMPYKWRAFVLLQQVYECRKYR